jgi:hypothetical protein
MDSSKLLEKALKKRVAFVTGKAFFADPKEGTTSLRLNFTHPTDPLITEGLRRLGSVFNQEMVHRWDKSTTETEEKKMLDAVRGSLIGKS